MPIYEFYCGACHRVFSFLSRSIDTRKQPACPRCGQAGLQRRASAFAISKGRPEKSQGEDGLPDFPELDEARMEKAMESLAAEAEGLDENDPKAQAQLMRRLFDATGMPMNAGMHEAIRRLEAGEDPEAVEKEMGDVFEGEPFSPGQAKGAVLKGLRRQLPPSVDPALYEM